MIESLLFQVSAGKLADLVVVDRDPFAVPPDEIKNLMVVMTIVGGNIGYDAATAAPEASSP